MSERKKIAFLFGAGAEMKGNYKLLGGMEYISDVFCLQEKLKENVLVQCFPGEYFKQGDMKRPYTYRKDSMDFARIILRELVKRKVSEEPDFRDKYEHEIKQLLNKVELKEVKKDIQNHFKQILRTKRK